MKKLMNAKIVKFQETATIPLLLHKANLPLLNIIRWIDINYAINTPNSFHMADHEKYLFHVKTSITVYKKLYFINKNVKKCLLVWRSEPEIVASIRFHPRALLRHDPKS